MCRNLWPDADISLQTPTPELVVTCMPSFQIIRSQSCHYTCAVDKLCPEDSVGVCKHAVLQTDDNELAALESGADEAANVLRM